MYMKMRILTTIMAVMTMLLTVGCMKAPSMYDPTQLTAEEEAEIRSNAQQIFGNIDPKQDWNSITSGDVTVTADAALDNIAKVQILTESPIGNDNARVLAEADAEKGETLTLHYDAPNVYTRLFAACVDKDGYYYIKGFTPGTVNVNFTGSSRTKAITRAGNTTLPELSMLKLKSFAPTYNNIRTRQANAGDNTNNIGIWKDTGWENDTLWVVDNEEKLLVSATDFTDDEKADLQAIIDGYLTHENGWNQDNVSNVEKIRDSKINQANNYLTTDGGPITLTPVQITGTEQGACHLFYYYYNPADLVGKDEVSYIKSLPKYKAIQVWRTASQTGYSDKIFRLHTYSLLYYGDGRPQKGTQAVSYEFPKGYKIGFMMRKMKTGNWDQAETRYTASKNGECYGDGRLNNEINVWSLPKANDNHFSTANFEPNDPRIAFFSANKNLFMTVEDGSNRDYGDIIIQVDCGVRVGDVEEPEEPEAEAYTMCFEDRPFTADYDLNDVVLRCTRINKTTLSLALVATGANDDVIIRGAEGWELNNQEVHELFYATEPDARGNRFVNTVVGGTHREVQARYVKVDEGVTIPQYLQNIYIENMTTGKVVRYSQMGEPPYAIIVPEDFQYPMENQKITDAYLKFIQWAQDVNVSGDWYRYENSNKIFPSLFKKW